MHTLADPEVSTKIESTALIASNPSALEEKRQTVGWYKWPAIVLMMFSVPTSANIQLTQPVTTFSPSYIGAVGWRSRREGDVLEAELYAPFPREEWHDISPIRIPIVRYLQARILYLGRLEPRPPSAEI